MMVYLLLQTRANKEQNKNTRTQSNGACLSQYVIHYIHSHQRFGRGDGADSMQTINSIINGPYSPIRMTLSADRRAI